VNLNRHAEVSTEGHHGGGGGNLERLILLLWDWSVGGGCTKQWPELNCAVFPESWWPIVCWAGKQLWIPSNTTQCNVLIVHSKTLFYCMEKNNQHSINLTAPAVQFLRGTLWVHS